jgi:hypothetical protein
MSAELYANNVQQGRKRATPWTAEEDSLVAQLVEQYGGSARELAQYGPGNIKWLTIGNLVSNRSGKQCRERWHNLLNPNVERSTIWTLEEDLKIVECLKCIGTRWAECAKQLQGRTDNQIKNRWYSTVRRVERYHINAKLSFQQILAKAAQSKKNNNPLFYFCVEMGGKKIFTAQEASDFNQSNTTDFASNNLANNLNKKKQPSKTRPRAIATSHKIIAAVDMTPNSANPNNAHSSFFSVTDANFIDLNQIMLSNNEYHSSAVSNNSYSTSSIFSAAVSNSSVANSTHNSRCVSPISSASTVSQLSLGSSHSSNHSAALPLSVRRSIIPPTPLVLTKSNCSPVNQQKPQCTADSEEMISSAGEDLKNFPWPNDPRGSHSAKLNGLTPQFFVSSPNSAVLNLSPQLSAGSATSSASNISAMNRGFLSPYLSFPTPNLYINSNNKFRKNSYSGGLLFSPILLHSALPSPATPQPMNDLPAANPLSANNHLSNSGMMYLEMSESLSPSQFFDDSVLAKPNNKQAAAANMANSCPKQFLSHAQANSAFSKKREREESTAMNNAEGNSVHSMLPPPPKRFVPALNYSGSSTIANNIFLNLLADSTCFSSPRPLPHYFTNSLSASNISYTNYYSSNFGIV